MYAFPENSFLSWTFLFYTPLETKQSLTKKKLPAISAGKLTFQIALLPKEDGNLIYRLLAQSKSVKNIKYQFQIF